MHFEQFRQRVLRAEASLPNELRQFARLDRPPEYGAGQKIYILFDAGGAPCVDRDDAAFEISIWLSSKAEVSTIVFLQRVRDVFRGDGGWQSTESVPDELKDVATQLRDVLSREGFEFVDRGVLGERVVGVVTELDGAPATVFEALFSEIEL